MLYPALNGFSFRGADGTIIAAACTERRSLRGEVVTREAKQNKLRSDAKARDGVVSWPANNMRDGRASPYDSFVLLRP